MSKHRYKTGIEHGSVVWAYGKMGVFSGLGPTSTPWMEGFDDLGEAGQGEKVAQVYVGDGKLSILTPYVCKTMPTEAESLEALVKAELAALLKSVLNGAAQHLETLHNRYRACTKAADGALKAACTNAP